MIAAALILLLGQGEVGAAPKGFAAKQAGSSGAKVSDSGDAAADLAALSDDLQKNLADTQVELADELASSKAMPDSQVKKEGALPRGLILQMLIHAYEVQLQRIKELQDRLQLFAHWQKEGGDQARVDNRAPFPFLVEDELRESLVLYDKRLARLGDMLVSVENELARRLTLAEQSAAKLRQANEELERSQGMAKVLASDKRAALALQNRLDSIQVVAVQIEVRRIKQDMLEIRSKRDFANSQQTRLRERAQLTEQDVQTVRNDIQAERQRILTELETTVAELRDIKASIKSAQNAGDGSAKGTDVSQHALQQTAEFKLQALRWMLEFLQLRQVIWEYRWSSATVDDREQAREAYERIAKWQLNLKVAREYVQQLRLLALDAFTDQIKKSEGIQPIEPKQDIEPPALDVERVTMLSQLLAVLESDESLLLRWQQELDMRFRVKSKAERWNEVLSTVRKWAGETWSYELFTAEDVIEADGQQIKGRRSITVDKVVSALLILIFGYWLAVKLATFIERLAVRRFAIDASLARIGRRWILFIEVVTLATASLMMVRIPLTVFAFMGGAVAIGAGFGMQNLLKNLISGLMLLLERPFRPGDLVEVSGIRGRITDIGVRSSQIRDGNGIETLIPNSTFIEEKVTNWTLSSQSVRISVKVGVAYGSPVQEVADILREAAERHGMIQEKPAPQVLFEDFGSDALIFGLYVWLELSPDVDWRVVASDLRHMINKSFAARGISMAFPQRDVHLDVNQPMEIRVLNNPPIDE